MHIVVYAYADAYTKRKYLDICNFGEGKAGDGKVAGWLSWDTSNKMRG